MTIEPGPCAHETVTSDGIVTDAGGQVHEVGVCAGCGHHLQRAHPLQDWSPADDAPLAEPEV